LSINQLGLSVWTGIIIYGLIVSIAKLISFFDACPIVSVCF